MKQRNVLLSVIVFAILTRISIPFMFGHLPNFSALDALALFCGAYCKRRMTAIALCIGSVWLSDILLTHMLFYPGFYWQYASYGLIVLLGAWVASPGDYRVAKNAPRNNIRLATMPLASASLFFAISNFGVWFSSAMYPHTADGLIACYIAAIPFFKYTLVSDVVFTVVLFGMMKTFEGQMGGLRGKECRVD